MNLHISTLVHTKKQASVTVKTSLNAANIPKEIHASTVQSRENNQTDKIKNQRGFYY